MYLQWANSNKSDRLFEIIAKDWKVNVTDENASFIIEKENELCDYIVKLFDSHATLKNVSSNLSRLIHSIKSNTIQLSDMYDLIEIENAMYSLLKFDKEEIDLNTEYMHHKLKSNVKEQFKTSVRITFPKFTHEFVIAGMMSTIPTLMYFHKLPYGFSYEEFKKHLQPTESDFELEYSHTYIKETIPIYETEIIDLQVHIMNRITNIPFYIIDTLAHALIKEGIDTNLREAGGFGKLNKKVVLYYQNGLFLGHEIIDSKSNGICYVVDVCTKFINFYNTP